MCSYAISTSCVHDREQREKMNEKLGIKSDERGLKSRSGWFVGLNGGDRWISLRFRLGI